MRGSACIGARTAPRSRRTQAQGLGSGRIDSGRRKPWRPVLEPRAFPVWASEVPCCFATVKGARWASSGYYARWRGRQSEGASALGAVTSLLFSLFQGIEGKTETGSQQTHPTANHLKSSCKSLICRGLFLPTATPPACIGAIPKTLRCSGRSSRSTQGLLRRRDAARAGARGGLHGVCPRSLG